MKYKKYIHMQSNALLPFSETLQINVYPHIAYIHFQHLMTITKEDYINRIRKNWTVDTMRKFLTELTTFTWTSIFKFLKSER